MPSPFYKQYDTMDCGPTCLRMIAKHYKKTFSPQNLRERAQIGKDEVNLLGISEAAEAIGFRTQKIKFDFESTTKKALLPAILHWSQDHFAVLYKAKRNQFFVADPAKGLITYSPIEFKAHWVSDKNNGQQDGIALLLEPIPAFYDEQSEEETKVSQGLHFKNIFNYILPYKK